MPLPHGHVSRPVHHRSIAPFGFSRPRPSEDNRLCAAGPRVCLGAQYESESLVADGVQSISDRGECWLKRINCIFDRTLLPTIRTSQRYKRLRELDNMINPSFPCSS
jgi:hypothetical protein